MPAHLWWILVRSCPELRFLALRGSLIKPAPVDATHSGLSTFTDSARNGGPLSSAYIPSQFITRRFLCSSGTHRLKRCALRLRGRNNYREVYLTPANLGLRRQQYSLLLNVTYVSIGETALPRCSLAGNTKLQFVPLQMFSLSGSFDPISHLSTRYRPTLIRKGIRNGRKPKGKVA